MAGSSQKKAKKFRGIFNRYQKSKGLWKYVLEDCRAFFILIWLFFRNGLRHRVILVYPHLPSKRSTLYRIARALGYYLTNKPTPRASVAVYWEYQTFRSEFQFLEEFCDQHEIRLVNRYSRDISKIYVDRAFTQVFSYSTTIDPSQHQGFCVEKSDINAKHDGRVLTCPLPPEAIAPPGEKIYQILIDNSAGPELVKDLRVPIYGDLIPFVFAKYRPVGERFKNTTIKTELYEPGEVLAAGEIAQIKAFCASIQLEHGELDVLRDNHSGRIYIVDVNNTPQSPPAHTPKPIEKRAVQLMAAAFAKTFLAEK